MASVFGSAALPFQTHGGSFRAEDLTLTLPNGVGDGTGALVQQIQFTLTRQINMLYEIGSANVYYSGNRRQGQAQITRLVSGSKNFGAMVTAYGNMCTPAHLKLGMSSSACGKNKASLSYELKSATLTSIGGSVSAQEVVVSENLAFMFLDLDYAQT